MKNFFIIIFFFFCCLNFKSQTKRFYYGVTFKLDSSLTQKDVAVLDINPDSNYFYSNEYLKIDSLNNSGSSFQFAYPKFKKIVKWSKHNNNFEMYNNLSMNYYVFSFQPSLTWTLTSEKKTIANYTVQKAIGNYGGRKWIAWFTSDIPLNFGPYVFYGLPGLVLEVYDTNDDYHFTFLQNLNIDIHSDSENLLDKYLGLNKFTISQEDWKKIQSNYFNNPIPEYKSGQAMMIKNDGTSYTSKDFRDMELTIQNQMIRYNNPIELDQKVDFKKLKN